MIIFKVFFKTCLILKCDFIFLFYTFSIFRIIIIAYMSLNLYRFPLKKCTSVVGDVNSRGMSVGVILGVYRNSLYFWLDFAITLNCSKKKKFFLIKKKTVSF